MTPRRCKRCQIEVAKRKQYCETCRVAKRKEIEAEGRKKYYAKNRERLLTRSKKWQDENPEQVLECRRKNYHAARETDDAWYRERLEKLKAAHVRRKYGLSSEEYNAILTKQGGGCAICREVCITGCKLSVDHDHDTGRVRGLLCKRCNTGIGMFQERRELVEKAVGYLS